MSARSVLPAGVLAAASLLAGLAPASSSSAEAVVALADDDAEFRALVAQAVAELEAERYHEALALFAQAHQRAPSARTLRGLGIVSFELGDYVAAMSYLDASLRDPRRPLTDTQRDEITAVLTRVRAFVGQVRVDVSPARAELWIDGQPVDPAQRRSILLSVGDHDLEARAPGFVPAVRKLRVPGGEPIVLRVALEPVLTNGVRGPLASSTELRADDDSDPRVAAPAGRAWYASPWLWTGAVLAVAVGTGVALAVARPFAEERTGPVVVSPNTPAGGVLSAARWLP